MINRVIDYESTGAAGVEDGVVSVFSTRAVEVGSGECLCMKGGPKDGLIFAVCTLMNYSIIDVEVADVLGDTWPLICTNEGEGVVAGITRVVTHLLSPWVVSILFLSLSGGVSHPCWVSGATEESRWGAVDRSFIFVLHIWFNDVGKNRDVAEMQEVIEGVVRDKDGMCGLAAPAHDSNGGHEMVSPFFDNIKWGGVGCSVAYNALCHPLYVTYFFLAGRDAVFALRSRWGNGGNGFVNCPGYHRGVASVEGGKLAHLSHDDHSFGNLEGFSFTLHLVWGIRGG